MGDTSLSAPADEVQMSAVGDHVPREEVLTGVL